MRPATQFYQLDKYYYRTNLNMPLYTKQQLVDIARAAEKQHGATVDRILTSFSLKPNLGVEREDMPQIDDVEAFAAELAKIGVPCTRTIVHDPTFINPTQKHLSDIKILSNVVRDAKEPGSWRNRIYIVSSDNYLLDGHHTWALCLAPSVKPLFIRTIKAHIPMHDLLQIARQSSLSEYKKLHEDQIESPTRTLPEMLTSIVDGYPVLVESVTDRTFVYRDPSNGNLRSRFIDSSMVTCWSEHAELLTEGQGVRLNKRFDTVSDAENELADLIAGSKKVVYETGAVFYFNDQCAIVKLWPIMPHGFVADVDELPKEDGAQMLKDLHLSNVQINESIQVLNEDAFVPGQHIMPDKFDAFLKSKAAFFRPESWNPVEQEIQGTLYLPIIKESKFDATEGNKNKLAEAFKVHLESSISGLADKSPVTYLTDSITIVAGRQQMKDSKVYGRIQRDTMYAGVIIRMHMPELDDHKAYSDLIDQVNKHPQYGVIVGSDHSAMMIYVPFRIGPHDYEQMKKATMQKKSIEGHAAFINWLNHAGHTSFNPTTVLQNNQNILHNDLINNGFVPTPAGVYEPKQVARLSTMSPRSNGYLYMGFKCSQVVDLKESRRVARTLIDVSGFNVSDLSLSDRDRQVLIESDSYIQFLEEDWKDNARTTWNFLAGKGKKIKKLGNALETALVQQVVAELDAKIRTRNMKDQKQIDTVRDIAEKKAEAQAGVAEDTKDKMDNIAGKDKRLQKIATRSKIEASLEANKKKLQYLDKLSASESAKKKVQQTIDNQEGYLEKTKDDDIPDDAREEGEEAGSEQEGGSNDETSRKAPSMDDDSDEDIFKKMQDEKDPTKRVELNKEYHKRLSKKQDDRIKDLEEKVFKAKRDKDKEAVKKHEADLLKAKKKKEQLDGKVKELEPGGIEEKRQQLNKDIEEINAYIKEQSAELKEVVKKITDDLSGSQRTPLLKQKLEIEQNILNSKIESYESVEKYYALVGNMEKAREYKEKRDKAHDLLSKLDIDYKDIAKDRSKDA